MAYIYKSKMQGQALFGEINELLGDIKSTSGLLQLASSIDWDTMCDMISEGYSWKGRGSNNVRMMLGLEILKHIRKGLSDESLVKSLQSDMVVMRFCGIENIYDESRIIDSSSMTKFRNRISAVPGLLDKIQNVHVERIVKTKVPYRKRGQYDQDSTVVEEKIAYPRDIDLLGKIIEKSSELTDKGKKIMGKIRENVVNKGKRTAQKIQDAYHFGKEKSQDKIVEYKKNLIKIGEKTIEQMTIISKDLEKLVETGSKEAEKLHKKFKELITTGTTILQQQKQIIINKGKTVTNRILSLHKPYIRSIVKGKSGKKVEFGAKVQIGMIGRKVAMIVKHSRDNEHDAKTVNNGIEKFEEIIGRKPKEAGFDKGYRDKNVNDPYLEEVGVLNCIQGSEAWGELSKGQRKRRYNRRAFLEPVINDIKNHRGANKNLLKESNAYGGLIFAVMASNYVRVYL